MLLHNLWSTRKVVPVCTHCDGRVTADGDVNWWDFHGVESDETDVPSRNVSEVSYIDHYLKADARRREPRPEPEGPNDVAIFDKTLARSRCIAGFEMSVKVHTERFGVELLFDITTT